MLFFISQVLILKLYYICNGSGGEGGINVILNKLFLPWLSFHGSPYFSNHYFPKFPSPSPLLCPLKFWASPSFQAILIYNLLNN